MNTNFLQKKSIQETVNTNAITRALETIQSTGRALPCVVIGVSGALVTISFDVESSTWTIPNITIPKIESNWIKNPTQVGDKGFTVPSDLYLDKVSGQTTNTPTLGSSVPNLSALAFIPISNINSVLPDSNAALIQGPNGAIIQTADGTTAKIIVNSSQISLIFGSSSIVINSSGVIINGINFSTHLHGGVVTGTSNTTGPI